MTVDMRHIYGNMDASPTRVSSSEGGTHSPRGGKAPGCTDVCVPVDVCVHACTVTCMFL